MHLHCSNQVFLKAIDTLTPGKKSIRLLGGSNPCDKTHWFQVNGSLWAPFLPAAVMVDSVSDFGPKGSFGEVLSLSRGVPKIIVKLLFAFFKIELHL